MNIHVQGFALCAEHNRRFWIYVPQPDPDNGLFGGLEIALAEGAAAEPFGPGDTLSVEGFIPEEGEEPVLTARAVVREDDEQALYESCLRIPMSEALQLRGQMHGTCLLDVRSVSEFREGHIPSAELCSLNALQAGMIDLEDCEGPIFLYCHSGMRAGMAAAFLRQQGFCPVFSIGGLNSYGGRLESGL